ncbi:ubiquinone/menaquinone biosynthesis protein [Candidatus Thiomargarita nelsonii]|uniref:Ubiquinone/menaquinone biosynthesis protein n=1 Tax=Candidatus Thiomargarita nelsonii TaxID=1003181 RepID=A0A0A6P9P1_9GAMM|nr:ubiquinone/menaquinone biosynthesis protein [Candidatus Thiomargarita nelsonii]
MAHKQTSEESDSQSWDIIKESHALSGESEELDKYYHKWADTYNEDVLNEQYSGPKYIVNFFTKLQNQEPENKREAKLGILDAGCGTGLVGIALKQKGYSHIDGCDLSEKMVEIAHQTDVYSSLTAGVDLNNMTDFQEKQYDVTISCGVFTLGHVPPSALEELIRITKTGGLVVMSTRNSYYDSTDFQAVCDRLENEGHIKVVEHIVGPYIAEEGSHYWAFRVC